MKPLWRLCGVLMVVLFTLVLVVAGVQAGGVLLWQANGVPISVAPYGQTDPQSVSDGAGGAIIVWQDFRSGTNQDIYAQRINSAGQVQWSTNGVPVAAAAGDQVAPAVTTDGQNGAIIVWEDKLNGTDYNIFAQRVSANGLPLWNTNGVTICGASGMQDTPQIASDGQGGAIIVWEDNRSTDHWDVYAQRISANGTPSWAINGISLGVINTSYDSPLPVIVGDNQSGAIIAWMHSIPSDVQVYAQRVLSNGVSSWALGGVRIVSDTWTWYPYMVPDREGGAIVAGQGHAVGVQRVLSNGLTLWGTNGITLATGNLALNPRLIGDGVQGVFASWQLYGSGYTSSQIIVQHVLSNSMSEWAASGITTTSQSGLQEVPRLVNDGFGGVIVVWQTATDSSGTDYSIWSQRLDLAGIPQWGIDGIQVISSTAYRMHSTVTGDDSHGAIVAWEDQRSGGASDIFAQRIFDFTPTAWVYLPMIRK